MVERSGGLLFEIAGSLVLGGNLWNSRESGEGVSGAARSHGVEGVIECVRLEIESGRKGVLEDALQLLFFNGIRK